VNRVVGLDFDNTLADYGGLFQEAAVDEGFLPPGAAASKQMIRDALRALPDGEMAWRAVQARVYGRDIARAALPAGVKDFLARLGRQGLRAFVVSHKTPAAWRRGERLDLRAAALHFLHAHGLFDPSWSPLAPDRIFFESTRREKALRIARLGCTDFVDDLPEVFLDPTFPPGVRQLLYWPQGDAPEAFGGLICRDWGRVAGAVFGDDSHG
jgi:hypothetical protein